MLFLTAKEKKLIKKLNTPAKIQDYLNNIPFNFEEGNIETLSSPLKTLRKNKAHCFEGALLGSFLLSFLGHKMLILNLKAKKGDFDHVISLFRENNLWGALSKTNHPVLRYREPVYKNIRELVMSYFHEYFLNSGEKTLRKYSEPLNLNIFEKNWPFLEENLWGIDQELDKVKYVNIVPAFLIKKMRKVDKIEIEASNAVDFLPPLTLNKK
jgi:hypothetical protein